MHYKDHSVLEFNINIKRDGLAASQKNHLGTAALVLDLPVSQDKESHLAGAFTDNLNPNHKATGGQNLSVYSDWVELDLRVL